MGSQRQPAGAPATLADGRADAAKFTGIDAGLWLRGPMGTAGWPGGDGWYTVAEGLGAEGWDAGGGEAAAAGAAGDSGVIFVPVALDAFYGWLSAETARLAKAGASGGVRRFPRLELPTSTATRDFLKSLDHEAIAAWLRAQEGAAASWLVRSGDYNRAALDLRKLLAAHRDRRDPQQRHRLAMILDDFGNDDAGNWQAGMRLGVNQPVYLLSRGMPGVGADGQGDSPEALPGADRDRAEELYHHAVGELGTERILFGSGLAADAAGRGERQAALAAWFCAPRPWLDAASVGLMFGANQRRLLVAPASGGLDSQPVGEMHP